MLTIGELSWASDKGKISRLCSMELASKVLAGDIRAASKLISAVEDRLPEAWEEMKKIYPYTGKAYVVGVTGPSGTGKSTIVDCITAHLRKMGKTVGIIAVDPSSPFSGGAILGDRVRMQRHGNDQGVFIRSMATRGCLGGLSRATADAVKILDSTGFDVIMVETVGVGQDEVDIAKEAHTTLVVIVPGLGDDIQALKAGVLEIGDIFVVNKADRPDADKTAREIEIMLNMGGGKDGWHAPVLMTVALTDEGIAQLVDSMLRHRQHLISTAGLNKLQIEKSRSELIELLKERMMHHVIGDVLGEEALREYAEAIAERKKDPFSAVDEIMRWAFK